VTTNQAEEMDGPLPANLVEMWEHFLRHPPQAFGAKNECIDHYIFDTDLFPLQRKRELARMIQLAQRIEPKVVMSIGCDKGGELWHWCEFVPSVKRVIACEVRGVPYHRVFSRKFPDIDFLWLGCSSYGNYSDVTTTREIVAGWLKDDKIDVLFIDGDKSEFLTDFRAYRPLMSNRGMVFMHDVHDPAPGEAWAEVRDHSGLRTFELYDTTEVMDLLLSGRPPRNGHEQWLKVWMGRSCGIGCVFMPECKVIP
jgi:hypothetical protein